MEVVLVESTDEYLLVWLYSPMRDLQWQVKTESSVGCAFDDEDSFLFLRFSLEVYLRASSPFLWLDVSSCFQAALLSARESQLV